MLLSFKNLERVCFMEPGFLDKITWTSSTPIYAMVNLVILDQSLPDSRSMPTAKGRRHRPPSRRHRSMPTAAVGIDPSA